MAITVWTTLNPVECALSPKMLRTKTTHTNTVHAQNARNSVAWPRVMGRRYRAGRAGWLRPGPARYVDPQVKSADRGMGPWQS